MVCDNYGYMWFATENGLVRFNGRCFEQITLPIDDREIINLYLKGNMLFLCNFTGQIAAIDLSRQCFMDTRDLNAWLKKEKNAQQPISVAGLIKDTLYLSDLRRSGSQYYSAGRIIVCKTGRDNFGGRIRMHYRVPGDFPTPGEIFTAGAQRIYGLQFTDHTILFENKIYDIAGDSIRELFSGRKYRLKGTIVGCARRKNDLYVAYHDGPGVLKFQDYFSRAGMQKPPETIVSGEKILNMIVDRAENLWISLYKGGLIMIPLEAGVIKHYDKELDDLHENGVSYIQQEGASLLMAYKDGTFDIMDSTGVRHLSICILPKEDPVKAIVTGNTRWSIITHSAMISFAANATTSLPQGQATHLQPAPIKDISATAGVYYVCAKDKYYTLSPNTLPKAQARFPHPTMSVAVLPDGRKALGTLQGIYVANKLISGTENDRFNSIRHFNDGLVGCSMNAVYIIRGDKVVRRLTQDDGMLGSIYTDVQASPGFYYALSESGITLIDRNKLRVAGILSGKEFVVRVRINSFCTHNGFVFLGTNKGIFKIPEEYLCRKNVAPPIYIHPQAAKGCLSSLESKGELVFSTKRSAQLQVDILNYKNDPVQTSYSVLKDGKPHIGSALLLENAVRIDRPTPGAYTINVTASSRQGGWQRTKSYELIVRPLWYQTFFFKASLVTASLIFLLFLSRFLYTARLRTVQKKIEGRSRLAELNSQALFAQMKPHFIFNALNPLQSFILKNNKEGALDYLEQFAALTRDLLNQSRDKYSTLESELRFIERYLFIARTRFVDSFAYHIDMAPGTDLTLLLPTMLLQPLVENAIDHGVKSLSHGDGVICIYIECTANQLNVLIADNGPGFHHPPFTNGNHALSIIAERLALIKEETGTGSISISRNEAADTTEVSLFLPLVKH